MSRWSVAFADGTVCALSTARGYRDAVDRARKQTGSTAPVKAVQRRRGGEFVYRLTTWRPRCQS